MLLSPAGPGRFLVGTSTLLLAVACSPRPPDESTYVERMEAARAAKDEAFRTASDSPVPENRKDMLLPLAYYPVDPSYNVPGTLKPTPDSPTMMMLTSTGTEELMHRVGQLHFTLHGRPLALTAFVSATSRDTSRLFIPFKDPTSDSTTYGSGRYLELDRTPSGVYEVDFNTAFNPYCYYSLAYVCPLPPPENRLEVPIEAGERIRDKG